MKRSFKKWMGMMVCLLLAACMLTGCSLGSGLADCFDKDTLIQQAKEDIQLAQSNDFEGWKARFAQSLQAQLTEDVYTQYLGTLETLGAFQEFGKVAVVGQEQDGENYAGVVIQVDYAEKDAKYSLGYDEDMNLIQFLIQ